MLKSLIQNRIVSWLVSQIGPDSESWLKQWNLREMLRIAITAGLFGGGMAAVIPALIANVTLYVSQENVGLVSAFLAFVLEAIRRYNHGRPVPSQ